SGATVTAALPLKLPDVAVTLPAELKDGAVNNVVKLGPGVTVAPDTVVDHVGRMSTDAPVPFGPSKPLAVNVRFALNGNVTGDGDTKIDAMVPGNRVSQRRLSI